MGGKRKVSDCSVCLGDAGPKQPWNCAVCTPVVCGKCVGKLVKICTKGWPCASYKCPTCRDDVFFLIHQVQNPTVLHHIIKEYQNSIGTEFSITLDNLEEDEEDE